MCRFKKFCFVSILGFTLPLLGNLYAQNQTDGNPRAADRKLEAVYEKLEQMEKAIENLKKEQEEIKNLIMEEHKRTRKWISAR